MELRGTPAAGIAPLNALRERTSACGTAWAGWHGRRYTVLSACIVADDRPLLAGDGWQTRSIPSLARDKTSSRQDQERLGLARPPVSDRTANAINPSSCNASRRAMTPGLPLHCGGRLPVTAKVGAACGLCDRRMITYLSSTRLPVRHTLPHSHALPTAQLISTGRA